MRAPIKQTVMAGYAPSPSCDCRHTHSTSASQARPALVGVRVTFEPTAWFWFVGSPAPPHAESISALIANPMLVRIDMGSPVFSSKS